MAGVQGAGGRLPIVIGFRRREAQVDDRTVGSGRKRLKGLGGGLEVGSGGMDSLGRREAERGRDSAESVRCMSFCVALEISGSCIKGSTTTDRRAHNRAIGESRIDVGITSPEHRCSSSGPGDVHGMELGIAGASPDVLAVVQMSVCRSW